MLGDELSISTDYGVSYVFPFAKSKKIQKTILFTSICYFFSSVIFCTILGRLNKISISLLKSKSPSQFNMKFLLNHLDNITCMTITEVNQTISKLTCPIQRSNIYFNFKWYGNHVIWYAIHQWKLFHSTLKSQWYKQTKPARGSTMLTSFQQTSN